MTHKFRFDDVLYALEMKAPALRRWLALGLIGNTAKGNDREGWALEFTCHDLAVLALVKAMTEFGVPVATAHAFAVRLVRQQGPWSGKEPAEAYWNVFAPDFQIQVSRVVDKKSGKAGWGVATFEGTDAFACGAHLTLHPRELISRVIGRAVEAIETREEKRRA
jgi:hypothetical protein